MIRSHSMLPGDEEPRTKLGYPFHLHSAKVASCSHDAQAREFRAPKQRDIPTQLFTYDNLVQNHGLSLPIHDLDLSACTPRPPSNPFSPRRHILTCSSLDRHGYRGTALPRVHRPCLTRRASKTYFRPITTGGTDRGGPATGRFPFAKLSKL